MTISITKPDLAETIHVDFNAGQPQRDGRITYRLSVRNDSLVPPNGTQAVIQLPEGVTLIDSPDGPYTQSGRRVIVTLGRLATGYSKMVRIDSAVGPSVRVTRDINCPGMGSLRHGASQ